MSDIIVRRKSENTFTVEVREGTSTTTHEVTCTPEHIHRFSDGAEPERLLEASFEFLLEREPKESILRKFELPVIERYFPEYKNEIAKRL